MDRTAKVLVVEDEDDIRSLLLHNLRKEGYEALGAPDGEEGLRLAVMHKPDLIVLDLMLPGMDGMAVCRRLRTVPEVGRVPVLMLTARSEEEDMVAGLEAGADDYVPKPFSNRVLLARVRSLLRRSGQPAGFPDDGEEDELTAGAVRLVPSRREVTVNNKKVDLTAGEFDMLRVMMRRPGIVFSRGQLIDLVHGTYHAVTDRAVDVQILGLRRKLGRAGKLVETVRGAGYRVSAKA